MTRTQTHARAIAKKPATLYVVNSLWGLVALALLIAATMPVAARGAPDSFADLAERLSPAVVNISTTQTIERRRMRLPQGPQDGPFGEFWDEFRERFGEEDEPETQEAKASGSGFIIDPDGYVVTNNHVIDKANSITVILSDGTEFEADVIGSDARSDLALLKISRDKPFPAVAFADHEDDRIGDWVMAIGNPFGLGGSVTAGIISARNRPVGIAGPDVDYIQTDAPINRGNSGGPLFNMDGEVIGVNSAILSPSGGNVGIGFAIPSIYAAYGVEQLKEHGRIKRGWLGVFIGEFNEEAAESLGITDITSGVLVSGVQDDSPASAAGFAVGDIIYRWDGTRVENTRELRREVALTEIGKAVKVNILRGGDRMTLSVVTGELEDTEDESDGSSEQSEGDGDDRRGADRQIVEGMEIGLVTDEIRERFNLGDDAEGAVVLRVSRRSNAFRAGIQPGVIIQRVNQSVTTTPQDVVEAVEAAREAGRESVLFLIANARGASGYVNIELEKD